MSVLFTGLVLLALVFWLGVSYRRIVRLRILVSQAWRLLDQQVKRRLEIVGKSLELAINAGIKGAELERLVNAHARSTAYHGPSEAGQRTAELDRALNDLISFIGQHSESAGVLRAIAEDVKTVTQAIEGTRDIYNGCAATYNKAIGSVPGNFIAGIGGFSRAERF